MMILTRTTRYVSRAEPAHFVSSTEKVLIDDPVLKAMPDASAGVTARDRRDRLQAVPALRLAGQARKRHMPLDHEFVRHRQAEP